MGVFDLFSKRQKRLRGEVPDVFVYDKIPDTLRVQIVHIVRDAFGTDHPYTDGHARRTYESVHDALCREYGLFELQNHARSHEEGLFTFLLTVEHIDRVLDVIEISFRIIDRLIRTSYAYQHNTDRKIGPDDAIAELNARFKEHGIGFQYEAGELIRVDSQYIHAEAVKPVLSILRNLEFKGANDEFLRAHEHYRHGRHKECLVECLKAFESTLKSICQKRGWTMRPSDTAKTLLETCFSKGLLPSYLQAHFASLRAMLESGVPTVRNKLGGHGQGDEPVAVPEYMVRYALNATATGILLLAQAHDAVK